MEYFKADAGFQIVSGLRRSFVLVTVYQHILVAVDLVLFLPWSVRVFGKVGLVEIEARIRMLLIGVVDWWRATVQGIKHSSLTLPRLHTDSSWMSSSKALIWR